MATRAVIVVHFVAVGATRPPLAWVTGSGVAARRNSKTPSAAQSAASVVEVPLLALGHADVAQLDHVRREEERVLARARVRLEHVGVVRDRGDVVVVQPLDRVEADARRDVGVAVAVADAQPVHLPGAHEHDVARA